MQYFHQKCQQGFEKRQAHISALLIVAILFVSFLLPAAAADADSNSSKHTHRDSMFFDGGFLDRAWAFVPSVGNSCNERNKRPTSFWRETLLSQKWIHGCTDAVRPFRAYRVDVANGKIEKDENKRRALSNRYGQACLTPLSTLTDPAGGYCAPGNDQCSRNPKTSSMLISATSEEQIARLRRNIGELRVADRGEFCTASIVRFAKERVGLLTAAHCIGRLSRLRSSKGTGNNLNSRLSRVHKRLEFESLSGNQLVLEADATANGAKNRPFNRNTHDVALLDITDASFTSPNDAFPIAGTPMKLWEPLHIVGINPYLRERGSQSETTTLESVTSITVDPRCAVLSIQSGAIVHQCQTDGGLSGSPFIRIQDGKFSVSGVHIRGDLTGPSARCLPKNMSVGGPNRGIMIVDEK